MAVATRFRVILSLWAVVCCPNWGAAQTLGYAEAIDRLAVACGSDIRSLCKGVNLGGGRIRNCLAKNEAKVSSQCRTTHAQVFVMLEKRATAQRDVVRICETDARKLCVGIVRGDGNLLDCLLQAKRAVSAKCNQAITDAGYR